MTSVLKQKTFMLWAIHRLSSQSSKLAVFAGKVAFADFIARESLENMCRLGFWFPAASVQ